MMTLRFAARWPLWSIFTSFQCLALVQTDWQRQLLHQVNHTAHWMSKEFGPQLLDRLDRADVRGLLARCCKEVAQLPAEALVLELRKAVMAAEVVSGFSSEVNGSFFSFSLLEAEQVDHYENLWEVWVRNDVVNNYTHGFDWLETSFFGFKPFKEPAHPNSMEARERSAYFLLNSLRSDAGSPLYGDVSVVLKPSFAHATSILSPLDSGSWAGWCHGSYSPPKPSYAHNCSAFPGHQGLGTFQALDHLFSINEAYWSSPAAFLRPLARLLAGEDASTSMVGEDFVRYFEVLPTAEVTFSDVKFVIADFPSLFGTARGVAVRSWCQKNGWLLLWSLGLNVGFSTNQGRPHFWDVFNQPGPFRGRSRLIDPEFLGPLQPWQNVSSDLDAFNASWQLLQAKRGTALPLKPKDFHFAWTALEGQLSPDLWITPVRASCPDLDLCVGVTRKGCLCGAGGPPESVMI